MKGPRAYYNEHDSYAAQWIRNLIAAGLVMPGDVDERSIVDVRPSDLVGYTRCHFFAGVAGWDLALHLAGWPEARRVWTGSCPCPPFSSAARGRVRGFDDERDLWPTWSGLIAACRPPDVLGEQVAGASRWIDRTCDQLEAMGYAVGASVLTSLGVGADHLRPRIYFAGHADRDRQPRLSVDAEVAGLPWCDRQSGGVVPPDGLPDRMAVLGAFGNAIDPRVGAAFVGAVLEAAPSPASVETQTEGGRT